MNRFQSYNSPKSSSLFWARAVVNTADTTIMSCDTQAEAFDAMVVWATKNKAVFKQNEADKKLYAETSSLYRDESFCETEWKKMKAEAEAMRAEAVEKRLPILVAVQKETE